MDEGKEQSNDGTVGKHKEEGNQVQESTRHISIKTKVEDGGSNKRTRETGDQDAFSRYSDRNVRMTHLMELDIEDPEVANEDNTEWQRLMGFRDLRQYRDGANSTEERKTKLTFEVHISAFLHNA